VKIKFAALIVIAAITCASPAFAYVDPNAGGLIFQVVTPILAVLAAGLALVRRRFVLAVQRCCAAASGWMGRLWRRR
jgi:hypothetical protein